MNQDHPNQPDSRIGVQQLWENMVGDLRSAKTQQWSVSYYAILLDAAILGSYASLANSARDSVTLRVLMVLSLVTTTLFMGIFLSGGQLWMMKSRKTLNALYAPKKDYTTPGFQEVYRKVNPRNQIEAGFFKDSEVLIGLLLIQIGASSAGFWYVCRLGWAPNLAFVVVGSVLLAVVLCCYVHFKTKQEPKFEQ